MNKSSFLLYYKQETKAIGISIRHLRGFEVVCILHPDLVFSASKPLPFFAKQQHKQRARQINERFFENDYHTFQPMFILKISPKYEKHKVSSILSAHYGYSVGIHPAA